MRNGPDQMERGVEYKIEAFSQFWRSSELCEKAANRANELSADGWRIAKVEQGWSTFMVSTLYVVFERERVSRDA